jgi:hypothetical protein
MLFSPTIGAAITAGSIGFCGYAARRAAPQTRSIFAPSTVIATLP